MQKVMIILAACSLLMTGCAGKKKPEPVKPKGPVEKAKSQTASQVLIEGFTGKAAVDAHHRAKKEVTAAREKRDKELDEVFNGM